MTVRTIRRVAVVEQGSAYWFCEAAIGGKYYHPVAKVMSIDVAKRMVKGPQDEMIIVRFSDKRWAITTKEAAEGIKTIWAECSNLIDAEGMIP